MRGIFFVLRGLIACYCFIQVGLGQFEVRNQMLDILVDSP